MSKIAKIKIVNLKAIAEYEADFKGCTAIVTASNNQGKTTLLRSIPDRIRFIRPEVMVKKGSTQGEGELTLDTGERFVWEFNVEGKDTLHLFTKEGAKRNVTVDLGKQFFPAPFDIDKFLQSTPKEQSKQLQKIVGVDFTDIDKRYADAYLIRTDKNKAAEKFQVKLTKMMECPKVAFVDMDKLQAQKDVERTRLNKLFTDNKNANIAARNAWDEEKQRITDSENKRVNLLYTENHHYNDKTRINYEQACKAVDRVCKEQNDERVLLIQGYQDCIKANGVLLANGYKGSEIKEFLYSIEHDIPQEQNPSLLYPQQPEYRQEKFEPEYKFPEEPEYIQEMPDDAKLKEIDDQIFQAVQINQQAQQYKDYVDYKQSVDIAKDEADAANEAVKVIEAERTKLIQSAKFPAGIDITPDGITIDGLPLDRNQISTSKLYMAALRIASMNLGKVKTLYFDASFLDRASLDEIQAWAEKNDLQLLIERPSWEEQELHYEIVEQHTPTPTQSLSKDLFDKAA